MEVEIFIDKRKNKLKRSFKEDFKILCPFCSSLNKYLLNTSKDLYCKNCNELLVFIPDRSLVDGSKEGEKINASKLQTEPVMNTAYKTEAVPVKIAEKDLSNKTEARSIKIEERDLSNVEIGSHEKTKNENIKRIKITIEELKKRDFSFLSRSEEHTSELQSH